MARDTKMSTISPLTDTDLKLPERLTLSFGRSEEWEQNLSGARRGRKEVL